MAKAAAQVADGRGADVILSATDQAVLGIIDAAQEADSQTWVVPSYYDSFEIAPDVVLTSAVHGLADVSEAMITEHSTARSAPARSIEFDATNTPGIAAAPLYDNARMSVGEQLAIFEDIEARVRSGRHRDPGRDLRSTQQSVPSTRAARSTWPPSAAPPKADQHAHRDVLLSGGHGTREAPLRDQQLRGRVREVARSRQDSDRLHRHASRPHRSEEEITCPAPRARDKIPAHNMFQRFARDIGIPIIHVQHWQRHGGIDDLHRRQHNRMANWRVLYELYLPPNPTMDEHSWEGTKWLDLWSRRSRATTTSGPRSGCRRSTPPTSSSCCANSDVTNVVLTGTMTDACVLSTAFDAANRDFRVDRAPRCVAGYSEEAEEARCVIIAPPRTGHRRSGAASRVVRPQGCRRTAGTGRSRDITRHPDQTYRGTRLRNSEDRLHATEDIQTGAIDGQESIASPFGAANRKPLMPYSPASSAGGGCFWPASWLGLRDRTGAGGGW